MEPMGKQLKGKAHELLRDSARAIKKPTLEEKHRHLLNYNYSLHKAFTKTLRNSLQPLGPVQDRLKNVQQIQSSHRAFAAILGNGSVVTWGDAMHGGDSSDCVQFSFSFLPYITKYHNRAV